MIIKIIKSSSKCTYVMMIYSDCLVLRFCSIIQLALGLKNFCVSTVALPNTSDVSFTIVLADSEAATFSVTLPKNSPVSVITPRIDCDASSCGDVIIAGVAVGVLV
jgi:hypothetical protein